MKAKKLLSIITASILTMSIFTGCSSNEQSSTTEQSSAENQSGIQSCEVTFWHGMSGQQETTLKELTDQFNSENEYGITVTLVNQGSYNDLSTKLTANAAANTLPDMAQAYNSWLTPYLSKVVKLDDFVAEDFDNYEDIVEGYRQECETFGFIGALPFNKSTYVYFYNKTMFDELGLSAPETWEDLIKIGETFKNEKDMVSLGVDDMAGLLEASLEQNGVTYVTEEGTGFENEAGLEAIEFIMELYNKGYARLVGEDGYFSGPFSNQLVAAYIGSSTGVSYISAEGFEFDVAPLPGNVQGGANQAGTNLVMFSQDSNQQKATWEYMKFLTSKESTLKWAMETGYLPIRTSAYDSEEYQQFMSENSTAAACYAQSDSFFTTPAFEGSADIRTNTNTILEEQIFAKADAQTVYDALVEMINDELN